MTVWYTETGEILNTVHCTGAGIEGLRVECNSRNVSIFWTIHIKMATELTCARCGPLQAVGIVH